ncbi:MAG: DMT family transporter [Azospirillaceae bacterium]
MSGTPAPTSAPGAGRPASPPLLPLVLLLVLGLFWGAGFNMAKLASQNGVAPIGYAMWQSLPSGLIVLAFIMARGGRLPTGRRYLLFYAFAGIAGIAIPNMIAYGVIAHIPVGVWGVIINLAPLFTYLAALTLGAERIHPLRASGVVIGLIGVMLLVLPDSSLPDAGMVAWVLLGVLTPLIYGITNVLNARWRPVGGRPLEFACGMLLASGLFLLPASLLSGQFYLPDPANLTPGDLAIAIQVSTTCVAYVIYYMIIALAGPVFVGFVGYLVTLNALIGGMVLFGERHSDWLFAAMALIFTGMAMVNFAGRRQARAAMRAAKPADESKD